MESTAKQSKQVEIAFNSEDEKCPEALKEAKTEVPGEFRSHLGLSYGSAVECKDIEWVWPGRLAAGMFTILAGQPNVGKSYITLEMAAVLSRGGQWPDGAPNTCGPAQVIICSSEDFAHNAIIPRLKIAAANLDNILILKNVVLSKDGKTTPFVLDRHLSQLAEAIEAIKTYDTKPDAKMIIIDPISSFLGDVDSHNNTSVRGVLTPLAELADKHGILIVAVNHFNKSGGVNALNRSMGSIGFAAAARQIMMAGIDLDDPTGERRVLLGVKNNYGKIPDGLFYRLIESPGNPQHAAIVWEGTTPQNASDYCKQEVALEKGKPGPKGLAGDSAVEFIKKYLKEGPVPSALVKQSAENAGISSATFERTKKKMGIVSEKTADGWMMRPPDNANWQDETDDIPI